MSYDVCMRWDKEPFTLEEAKALPDKVIMKVGRAELRVADLLVLIRDYYDHHVTGGALHCALDDGNMDGVEYDLRVALMGHTYEFAGKTVVVPPDPAGALIAELLLAMSERDRFLLYRRGYGIDVAEHEFES